MTFQANVYTTPVTQIWSTDKCKIVALTDSTYQVSLAPSFADTIYSAPVSVPAGTVTEIYVGVGNQLDVTGTGTASELGTASSGTAGVT